MCMPAIRYAAHARAVSKIPLAPPASSRQRVQLTCAVDALTPWQPQSPA